MCFGTFISTLLITLLSVAVVLLITQHNSRKEESSRLQDPNKPEQLPLFDENVYGFSHDTDEFINRVVHAFSQSKKGT